LANQLQQMGGEQLKDPPRIIKIGDSAQHRPSSKNLLLPSDSKPAKWSHAVVPVHDIGFAR
jgi:hypothetical protein